VRTTKPRGSDNRYSSVPGTHFVIFRFAANYLSVPLTRIAPRERSDRGRVARVT